MVDRVARFGVSLPSKLLERFDEFVVEHIYKNRSKAIADAVNAFIVERRARDREAEVVGSISFAYDHHTGDVTRKLVEIQHQHARVIRASIHAHLSHSLCVESLIVAGKNKEITRLYDKIAAARGVQNTKLNTLADAHPQPQTPKKKAKNP